MYNVYLFHEKCYEPGIYRLPVTRNDNYRHHHHHYRNSYTSFPFFSVSHKRLSFQKVVIILYSIHIFLT